MSLAGSPFAGAIPAAGLGGPKSATAYRLPPGLLALEFSADPDALAGTPLVGGVALPPPSCALQLGPPEAPRLLVLARDTGAAGAVALRREDGAVIEAGATVRSAADFMRRWAGSAPGEQVALLRFLAVTAAPILRVATQPGFAMLLLRLAEAMPGLAVLRPLTRQAASALSLWEVQGPVPEGVWHAISAQGVRRIAAPVGGILMLDATAEAARPRLLLPPAGRDGAAPLPLRFGAAAETLPGPLQPAPDQPGAERDLLRALARRAAIAPEDGLAGRLLRDRRLLATPAEARRIDDAARPLGGALELALSDGGGGVFLRGWLRDPMGLIGQGLALRDLMTGAALPLGEAALHRVARPDIDKAFAAAPHGGAGAMAGFVAHLPAAERGFGGAVAQWGLDLRLASGEAVRLTAPPGLLPPERARALVLRAVAPEALSEAVLDACLTPAVTRLQRAALARLGAPERLAIGAAPGRPRVALVIPLYRNLRFLRVQVAALARDTALRAAAQIIYVLDSPEQREEVVHRLRGLHAIHGLPMTLVVMAGNAGYASASNAGAAAAAASVEHLLMLNSDVVPAAPGWLAAMLRPMRDSRVLAVGPKLLFDDGTVQHAGLFFQRHGAAGDWLNGHYGKGLARNHPAVRRARAVPGVTGAALLVRRAAFAAVGGFCTDYVVGDYEDSDLCLKLRELGGEIRYAPAAELFHFERQSIIGHAGYAETLACAHNRRLHHRRWDRAITGLMARFAMATRRRAA